MKHVSLLWDYIPVLSNETQTFIPLQKLHLRSSRRYSFLRSSQQAARETTRRREIFTDAVDIERDSRVAFRGLEERGNAAGTISFRQPRSRRFPAGSSICRYLPRRVIRAETSVYARRRRCAVSRVLHLRSAVCVVRVLAYVRNYVTRGTYLSRESSSSAAAESSLKVSLYLASGIVARAG